MTEEMFHAQYAPELLRIHGDGKLFETPEGFPNMRLNSKCPPILATVEEANGKTYECTLDELFAERKKEYEAQTKRIKKKHSERIRRSHVEKD